MNLTRREFIQRMISLGFTAAAAAALFNFYSCRPGTELTPVVSPEIPPATPPELPPPPADVPYLAVARGNDAAAMVNAAVKALGGIERYVKPGNDVIIKPNICSASHSYEYAATTNPEVVAAIITLCLGAGAKRVRVMDHPFSGTDESAYKRSGIADAVAAAGGEMEIMSSVNYVEIPIPEGIDIKKWSVYRDIMNADVVINVPIAKHHGSARLTMGMKNLLGVIKSPNMFHLNLAQRIADLNSMVRPQLTIIDAVRILMNHGPTGGDLNDVKLANTIIAGQDVVATDSYAATLFGLKGIDIPAVRAGADMGLGRINFDGIKIEEINV
jgi:uncharacterized protein (DUF362 family)